MIEVGGAFYGSYETSTLGTTWVNLTSASFTDDTSPTGAALPSGLVFVGYLAANVDAANALNLKYCAMTGAVAAGRTVAFGMQTTDNLHGGNVSTLAIRGGAANTDARVWASFVRP